MSEVVSLVNEKFSLFIDNLHIQRTAENKSL